jgi:hypothetical protein
MMMGQNTAQKEKEGIHTEQGGKICGSQKR